MESEIVGGESEYRSLVKECNESGWELLMGERLGKYLVSGLLMIGEQEKGVDLALMDKMIEEVFLPLDKQMALCLAQSFLKLYL